MKNKAQQLFLIQYLSISTASSIPVASSQNTLSNDERGKLLLQDVHLLEKPQHFNRQNIPERLMRARGTAAHGAFTVMRNISRHTKAILNSVLGEQPKMYMRFFIVDDGCAKVYSGGMSLPLAYQEAA